MRLARSTLYNLVGLGAPLGVAVFSIPALIAHLGDTRFGLLTLIWAVVSYFGLFDFGLGRALTQQLAPQLANGEHDRGWRTSVAASCLLMALGVAAGLLLAALSPLAYVWVSEPQLRAEVFRSLLVLAICMPAVTLTSGFRGVLEANHQFGVINLIRVPMGIFTFLGPWLSAVLFGPDLSMIAVILCAGRIAACALHAKYAVAVFGREKRPMVLDRSALRPLYTIGGWITVSNIISPLMGYADRFLISALMSAAALTYYVTPNEMVTKLWIIPGALTASLFPVFASRANDALGQHKLIGKSMHILVVAMLPPTLFIAYFAPELLSAWVTPEFAAKSATLTQIFCLGVFINTLAHIPYTLLQGRGAAKLTASLHLAEFLPYILLLALLTYFWGLPGAAAAWLIRLIADTGLLHYFSYTNLKLSPSTFFIPAGAVILGLELLGFALLLLPEDYTNRYAIFGLVATAAIATLLAHRTTKGTQEAAN